MLSRAGDFPGLRARGCPRPLRAGSLGGSRARVPARQDRHRPRPRLPLLQGNGDHHLTSSTVGRSSAPRRLPATPRRAPPSPGFAAPAGVDPQGSSSPPGRSAHGSASFWAGGFRRQGLVLDGVVHQGELLGGGCLGDGGKEHGGIHTGGGDRRSETRSALAKDLRPPAR